MLVAWMIYCTVLATLLAGGAWLLEKLVHLHRGGTRRVWALALLGAVLGPVFVWLRDVESGVVGAAPAFAVLVETMDPFFLEVIEGPLKTAWIAFSGLMIGSLAVAWARTMLNRRSWRQERVEGEEILVSKNVGPAVVGFFPGEIVLPEWALDVHRSERSLMMDHEREHLSARDPQLLCLTLVMLAAMPWNPVLWWIASRLRLAVEVDCDGRVLAAERCDPRTYGSLLLSVGGRASRWSHGMAAFSRPLSTLEHRILRMTDRERGPRWIKRGVLLAGVTVALLGAWTLPTPPPMGAWHGFTCCCDDSLLVTASVVQDGGQSAS
jgi:bla regulator protein BlaR1